MDSTTIITIAVIIVVFVVLFVVFKWLLRLLMVLAFLFFAWLTNPPIESHMRAVEKKADSQNISMKGKRIEIDDYYVFSLTKRIQQEDTKLIGAGAFTQVVIFSQP